MNTSSQIFLGAACLLLLNFPFISSSQNTPHRYDTDAALQKDLTKAGGEYDLYDFNLPAPTPAPKGYLPVYISHFGRHGSRYALGDNIYEDLDNIFRKGLKSGKLTETGKAFLDRYEKIYPKLAFRGGELTQKGQDQHQQIARQMIKSFPEVFQGETFAQAISTHSQRVIMSMAAFMNELISQDPDFSYTMDEGLVYYPVLHPNSSHNPYHVRSKSRSPEAKKAADEFMKKKLDLKSFGSRFFTDLDYLEKEYGLYHFMLDVRTFIVDLPSLDFEPEDCFSDMITDEELIHFWEVWNFNGYISMGLSPLSDNKNCLFYAPVVRNIFQEANEDLSEGKVQLRLRFTHDVALLPILSFLGVNSFGAVIEDPEEVKNYWRSFDVPMASNLQFIFFKNKKIETAQTRQKKKDLPAVLVKVLLNGKEAQLPLGEYSKGFYDWEKVQQYYHPIINQAESFIHQYQN